MGGFEREIGGQFVHIFLESTKNVLKKKHKGRVWIAAAVSMPDCWIRADEILVPFRYRVRVYREKLIVILTRHSHTVALYIGEYLREINGRITVILFTATREGI
ncbi:UNVERIFIED_CONTAM: hypothetical protein FKN15_015347 [Acipenser sinensis]